MSRILVINPGSTSTKVAVIDGADVEFRQNIDHDAAKLAEFPVLADQLPYRKAAITEALAEAGVELDGIAGVAGRGGGLVGLPGGTYKAEGLLLEHARVCFNGVKHPATLGVQLAAQFGAEHAVPAFCVNPPDVDEYDEVARITGVKGVYRHSRGHPLNHKEVAHRYAASLGLRYEEVNLIVAHIGGGISVCAHRRGRIVDGNDVVYGDGPMAPTRCGNVAVSSVADLIDAGTTTAELRALSTKNGGLVSHLGTSDAREVTDRIEAGDTYAELVYRAMIYQIGKAIGSMFAVLHGDVDGIVLTGGIANDRRVVSGISDMVADLGPVAVIAGELEMEGLASGVQRVLDGDEQAKEYTGEPVWNAPEDAQ